VAQNGDRKKIIDMSKKERWENHLHCLTRKIGFFVRRQARKGTDDFAEKINALNRQARILLVKINTDHESGLSA
jgi:hypothetical protein